MVSSNNDRFSNAFVASQTINTPYLAESTSLITVATGSQTFNLDTGYTNRAWRVGTRLRVSSTDAGKILEGDITTYTPNSTSVILNADYVVGSGSTNRWTLNITGVRGSSGSTGQTGSSGADGAGVATGGMADEILYKSATADFATAWRSLSAQIDAMVTETTGAILYRGPSGWVASTVGSTSQVLVGGAAPQFATFSAGLSGAGSSDQEQMTSTGVAVTPAVQQRHPSAAKAWAQVGMAATAITSYNVGSVTDVGTGQFRINFTTPFSSTNYACTVIGVAAGSTGFGGGRMFFAHTKRSTCCDVATQVDDGSDFAESNQNSIDSVFYGDQ